MLNFEQHKHLQIEKNSNREQPNQIQRNNFNPVPQSQNGREAGADQVNMINLHKLIHHSINIPNEHINTESIPEISKTELEYAI